MTHTELRPGLYRFEDDCNVYVVCGAEDCIAIDFGSGRWLEAFEALGLPPLSAVYLTHHHADQCHGLEREEPWPFVIHAPVGEETFLSPDGVRGFWLRRRAGGVPPSYSVLSKGLVDVVYDMAGFGDVFWGSRRIRFLGTPGHGACAVSILIDHGDEQVVFCGDAAHAGATVHQPRCLEWDHWTDTGARAAWRGVKGLGGVAIDLLCPSHGPALAADVADVLATLSERLLSLVRAKGSICAGEPDRYVEPSFTASGARQLSPHLFQFGSNGYVIVSEAGEAMVVDPFSGDMEALGGLLADLGDPSVAVATATHYHSDHSDRLAAMRDERGARVYLHPAVAEPLRDVAAMDVPWLPQESVEPDELWPDDGTWTWNEYEFRICHLPGQTWWHCGFVAAIDGRTVAFTGDSFQPASRWNGTGGFCAMNGCRFREGFAASARRLMDWKPDIVAAGHGTYVAYAQSYFTKVLDWAAATEATVTALCPRGDLERDYYALD